MKKRLSCIINSIKIDREVEESKTLLAFLREDLNLTGTKEGCSEGDCGACTVIVNGKSVNSCLFPALMAQGCEIVTIEGLEKDGEMTDIQKAFIKHGAVQCGFCSPGMIMSAKALLDENPHPDEKQIRRALSGNICRCTGYQQMVDAILELSKEK